MVVLQEYHYHKDPSSVQQRKSEIFQDIPAERGVHRGALCWYLKLLNLIQLGNPSG